MSETLASRIQSASATDGRVTFVSGDDHETITWADLHRDAKVMAAGLVSTGVTPGDHVAILGPTTRDLVTAIQAIWLAGGVLVMLPLPMRMGSLEQFIAQTRDRMVAADVSLVLIDRIPFPRPDDPLLSARQRAVAARGGNGFMAVAASHAALLLAQGAGRLLRRVTDRGVVAVLDSRMVTAGYGGYLRASLPPFWQTTDAALVRAALERLRTGSDHAADDESN